MAEGDAASLLFRLIDVAERMLFRNAMLEPDFDTLAAAITEQRIVPGHIIKDEATMLITALRACDRDRHGRQSPWRVVAFALLELVRVSLGRAIEERQTIAARPDPDAQPNYGRRGR